MEALNENTQATVIKNTIYVEANIINVYAKFQLHPQYGFQEEDFFFFFLENLAFRLPWPPIKISDLDKIHMQKHFSKTFVKISAATQK